MTIDGDTIEIDLDIDIEDISKVKKFVSVRLEYVDVIKVKGEMKNFASSSLFQLLHSIKKSKPSMIIDVVDTDLKLEEYGLVHWIRND